MIDPSSLSTLILTDTEITEIDRATFVHFLRLQNLNLDDNEVTHIPRNWYGASYSPKEYDITKISLAGNKISSLAPACFQHLNKLTSLDLGGPEPVRSFRSKQWIRFEAIGIVLHINRLTNDKFAIDWSGTLASKHTIPSDVDHCNPLSEALQSGHFESFSPFVIIARKSNLGVRKSILTECSEAWAAPGGVTLALQGQSSLMFSDVDTGVSQTSGGFSLVAKTEKNETVHPPGGVRQHSDHESSVACFTLLRDHKDVTMSSFNASTTNQVDDTKCLSQEHVSQANASGTSKNTTSSNEPTIPRTHHITVRPATTDVISEVGRTDSKTPLIVISVLTSPVIIMGFLALFYYAAKRRRNNNQNLKNNRPNLPTPFASGDITSVTSALHVNRMYRGSTQVTLQSGSTQDSCQPDNDLYDQIKEEEVYLPSGHVYSEIKDEDDRGESKPVSNSLPAHERNKIDEDIDSSFGHVPQKDASDSTGNVGASIPIYNADIKTEASVNRSLTNSAVMKSLCTEQTAYGMTDCTDDNELTHIPRNWYGASYSPKEYDITKISLAGNKISSLAPACFQHLNKLTSLDLGGPEPMRSFRSKQWIRFEAIGIVLHINRLTNDKFAIDWSGTLASKHTIPSDVDHCNPLSEALRSGHFESFSPFVIIARKSNLGVRKSILTECSEAWAASGGVTLALQGQSSLKFSDVDTGVSQTSGGFSLVAKTEKNETVHSPGGVRQHSDHESSVACFTLLRDHKDVTMSSFNASTTNQVDDTKCLSQEHVSQANASGTSKNTTSSNEPTIPRTHHITVRPATTDVISEVGRTDSKTPLIVISVLTSPVIIMGFIALFCYAAKRRRNNNQNMKTNRPNLPTPFASGDITSVLQVNRMSSGSTQVTLQSGSTQDSCQPDNDLYDQIKEEEVYLPSGHVYSEIKDEDDRGESKPVSNSLPAHERNKIDEDIDSSFGHVPQKEASDSTGNVGASIPIYNADIKTEASVNRSLTNSAVRKSLCTEQTAYGMTDCTGTSNRTDIYVTDERKKDQSEGGLLDTCDDAIREVD
ncbi:regulation of response to stimulus [Branchiostoma belcheri]|nr:regulation of response to stimulus [Branchiostoma belcheri]